MFNDDELHTKPRPFQINQKHWEEWLQSGVAPEIISDNIKSLAGTTPYDYLCYSERLERTNTGRLVSHLIRQYTHTELGGWWCSGLDPFDNWQPMLWGCLKCDRPRIDKEKQKPIKYETPPKTPTRIFVLNVRTRVARKIAAKVSATMEASWLKAEKDGKCFWQWLLENPAIPLFITEGAKKAGTLLTAGYAAIALPGIWNGCPKNSDGNPQLSKDIKVFCQWGRQIYLAFDQDEKPTTRINVATATKRLGWLLQQQGCRVSVCQWEPELGKGIDDVIFDHGEFVLDSIISQAVSLKKFSLPDYFALDYDYSVRVNERYLSCRIPHSEKLVAIKSKKGTGKTEAIAALASEAIRQGIPIILLTHRRQLAKQLSERLGIPYIEEIKSSPFGKTLGFALCSDSLRKDSLANFNAEVWDDCLLVIDEAEQVIWHTLDARTEISKHRVKVLSELKKLVNNIFNSESGQVIIADADLTNLSINFIKGLGDAPKLSPWLILNEWEGEGWDVVSFEDSTPSSWFAGLVEHIENGGKPFVFSSAQKPKSTWGTYNLERMLKKRFPEMRIIRFDQETLSDPSSPAYGSMDAVNQVLASNDIAIASPSLETGISIDLKGHFTSVWGQSSGNLPGTNFCQSLARVRDNIPRFIWCRSAGFGMIGNGSSYHKSILKGQDRKLRATLHLLREFDLNPEFIDDPVDPICLRTWAKNGSAD